MQAALSEMTTGVKSFFAKLAQPFFSGRTGQGKTDVPIKITATRKNPTFGIDVSQILH